MIHKKTIAFLLVFVPLLSFASDGIQKMKRSVVLIHNTSQKYRFDTPWIEGNPGGGSGTGFVIEGNLIMTNAHVVSDSRNIEVVRLNDDQKYVAHVKYIGHDCDLAVLEIEDPDFFKTMSPLELGELPSLNSVVTTYGFPLGGTHISVTRGVVSRIQQSAYAHSGNDSHLVIQTDAAINPGNSGGPVMQGNQLMGVAFQGLTQADNIGYMIPSIVVKHFLKDIEDGRVDGFGELGFRYQTYLQNPPLRKILALPEDHSGVVVTRVYPNMPAWDKLKPMDVLMEIDEYRIGDNGLILMDGREVEFPEVMERLQIGASVQVKIWRDKKEILMKLPLKLWEMAIPHQRPYDVAPKYYVYGGLCFTPLSRGYLMTIGGWRKASLTLRHLYLEAAADEELVLFDEFLVMSQRLPHEINRGADEYVGSVVEEINGEVIRRLEDLKNVLEISDKEEYVKIKFRGKEIPLVLSKADVKAFQESILKNYRVPAGERL